MVDSPLGDIVWSVGPKRFRVLHNAARVAKLLVQIAHHQVLVAVCLGEGGNGVGEHEDGALHHPVFRKVFHADALIHRYLGGGVAVDPAELAQVHSPGLRPVNPEDLRAVLKQGLGKIKGIRPQSADAELGIPGHIASIQGIGPQGKVATDRLGAKGIVPVVGRVAAFHASEAAGKCVPGDGPVLTGPGQSQPVLLGKVDGLQIGVAGKGRPGDVPAGFQRRFQCACRQRDQSERPA